MEPGGAPRLPRPSGQLGKEQKYGRIILASQSPRRRELLERMGVKNFRIVTPDIDEHMERELPPEELVRRISAEKARAVRNEQAWMRW